MAVRRLNLWDKATGGFSKRGNAIKPSPGGPTREGYGPGPIDTSGYGSPPSEEYGQGQFGPGWQSTQATWFDTSSDYLNSLGVNNMSDLYDLWMTNYPNNWGTGLANAWQYDDFYNWWQSLGDVDAWSTEYGPLEEGDMVSPGPGEAPWGGQGWNPYGGSSGPQSPGGGYGGGSQGGAGDLGTGSVFAGGGMGSSLYGGGGITSPFGEGWNAQGQIDYSGDPNEIDPGFNLDQDCLDQWYAMEDAGMGGDFGSYEEFAGLYCP